jgi:hypothetical protein
MSDHTPDSNHYRSGADRARERSPWLLRYKFPQLRLPLPRSTALRLSQAEVTWSVRGEPRTRETFGRPHPDDFPGGLPLPPEFPG